MVRIVAMDHSFENLAKNVEYLSTVLLTIVYFDLYYIYMLCTNIRGSQVPEGYTPFPFRRDTQESLLDKLRSVVATCRFRATIEYWKQRGADFSMHLYDQKLILLQRKRGMTEEIITTFSAEWQKVFVKAKTPSLTLRPSMMLSMIQKVA